MSDFKTLVGRRVLITKPERKKSSIELTAETEAAMEAEAMKQWIALEVYAVGEDTEKVKVGDKVYIGSNDLQSSEVVPMPDGTLKFMVHEGAIAIIW